MSRSLPQWRAMGRLNRAALQAASGFRIIHPFSGVVTPIFGNSYSNDEITFLSSSSLKRRELGHPMVNGLAYAASNETKVCLLLIL